MRLKRPPVLGMADSFDLWFSYIVLQHNPRSAIAQILQRALSLLAPGGLAILQLPARRSRERAVRKIRPAPVALSAPSLPPGRKQSGMSYSRMPCRQNQAR